MIQNAPEAAERESDTGRQVRIAVIDYGMGNLRSVCKALEHEGALPEIVTDPRALERFDGVVFPGQGAFGDCVASLNESGMGEAITSWIRDDRPYLGICLGLQVLFESSEEGGSPGLAIFPGKVLRFRLPPEFKIPHMGWNSAEFQQPDSPLTCNLRAGGECFYFVHSYYVAPEDRSLVLCETDYGGKFASGIGRGNCFATQFHPEKSQEKGLRLYRNFVLLAAENYRLVE